MPLYQNNACRDGVMRQDAQAECRIAINLLMFYLDYIVYELLQKEQAH